MKSKFLSILENYSKKINEDASNELPSNPQPAIPQGSADNTPAPAAAPTDDSDPVNVPESVVTLVRLLKKALVMELNPEDVTTVSKLPDVNENNANEIMDQLVSLMKQYSADIPIDTNTDTES